MVVTFCVGISSMFCSLTETLDYWRWSDLNCSAGVQVGTTAEALQTLATEAGEGVRTEGVMIGRAAWKRPWDILGDADRAVFGASENGATSRREVTAKTCY